MRIVTITSASALAGLAADWDQLLQQYTGRTPFLTHLWISTWWEAFGAGKDSHVLAVYDGDRCIAIAPFMRVRTRMYGVSVQSLELIGNLHTPRFDLIVADDRQDAYGAIWEHLQEQRSLWQVVKMPELVSDASTARAFRQLAPRCNSWPSMASPYVPIAGQFEQYLSALPAKFRANLRNRIKRAGATTVENAGPEHLDDGLRIEALAWKGQEGTAIAGHDDLRSFYRLLAARAAERDWLHLRFLRIGDTRAAFGFFLRYNHKLYLLKHGYEPSLSALSPFNLLFYWVLADAFTHGLSELDILGQDEGWKSQWTPHKRQQEWLFLFASGARAQLVQQVKFQLLPRLKRHAQRLGVGGA